MSFILDALRRTDREQKNGLNPGLETVIQVPQRPPAPRRTPWLAAVAILSLGAGVAMLLLWPDGDRQPPPVVATGTPSAPPAAMQSAPRPAAPPAAQSAAQSAARPATQPAGQPSTESVPSPDVPAGAGRFPQTMRQTPAAAVAENPALAAKRGEAGIPAEGSLATAVRERRGQVPATRRSPPVAQRDDAYQAAGIRPVPTPVQTTSARPPSPHPVAPEAPEPEVAAVLPPDPPAAPARTPTVPTQQRASGGRGAPAPGPAAPLMPATAAGVPHEGATPVGDLPPAQQAPFEGIRLDAHVYAEDAAQRFVLIRMRGHRVGDQIGADGPVIEAITPDGAILSSGAVRALIPHP